MYMYILDTHDLSIIIKHPLGLPPQKFYRFKDYAIKKCTREKAGYTDIIIHVQFHLFPPPLQYNGSHFFTFCISVMVYTCVY